jgi:hypothetical protein
LRLITPDGVRISVSDEKGEALLKRGYRRVPEETPEPEPAPKPTRKRKAKV